MILRFSPDRRPEQPSRAGFALIATLSIIVLLAFVMVGLMTIGSTSSRALKQAEESQKAKEHAQLALVEALNTLQSVAGHDTRITAPADISAGGVRQVTGVWRSWEGLDRDVANGFPLVPPYAEKSASADATDPNNEGRFLRWLISDETRAYNPNLPPAVTASATSIPLLSTGSVGTTNPQDEVHVEPTAVDGGTIAWWIQGENTKSLIAQPLANPQSNSEWSDRLASTAQPNVGVYGLDATMNLDKVLGLDGLNLAAESESTNLRELTSTSYHDMTVYAKGLLTNASTGGWKRDLSLLSETWGQLPQNDLSMFTLEPGVENQALKSNNGSKAVGSLIYPWAGAGTASSLRADFTPCATMSWDGLVEHMQYYKKVTHTAAGLPQVPPAYLRRDIDAPDRNKVYPIFARIHYVLSMAAADSSAGGYHPCILVEPVFTFWNPYNVAITTNKDFAIQCTRAAPVTVEYEITDSSGNVEANGSGEASLDDLMGSTIFYMINVHQMTWAPGEVRVFSGKDFTEDIDTNTLLKSAQIHCDPYYRTQSGVLLPLRSRYSQVVDAEDADDENTRLSYPATSTFKITGIKLNSGIGSHVGSQHVFQVNKRDDVAGINGYKNHSTIMLSETEAETYWGELIEPNVDAVSLSALKNESKPFLTAIYGIKTSIDSMDTITDHGHSYFENNALNITYQLSTDDAATLGAPRPEAFPHSWKFKAIPDRASQYAPHGTDMDPQGYLGTSHTAAEGFSQLIVAEVPLRPLLSLAELQHFNLIQPNIVPPFTVNAIGNSTASLSIPQTSVSLNGDQAANMSYDHSYVSNHLLFDDWFVSSIADTSTGFGGAGTDHDDVYTSHLTGAQPLANQAYQPVEYYDATDAVTQTATDLGATDAYRTVASRLEVNGMFNINSTSVDAWAAVLSSLSGASVPVIDETGITLEQAGNVTPITRGRINNRNNTTSGLTNAEQLKSYATLTDTEIRTLAGYIVDEVRLRGPFLSLSEFVNRQLVAGALGQAGALESALWRFSNDAGNALNELNTSFNDQVNSGESAVSYENDTLATALPTAYGMPGWVRQADLLRTLAPVMSVRDDTFKVRAYGDVRDRAGTVISRVWCEAVVQRTAEFVDEAANTAHESSASPQLSALNARLGRGFKIVAFRWLNEDEV